MPFLFGGRKRDPNIDLILDACEKAVKTFISGLGTHDFKVKRKKDQVEALADAEITARDAVSSLLQFITLELESRGFRVFLEQGPASASEAWKQAGGVGFFVGSAMERGYDAAGALLEVSSREGRYSIKVEASKLMGKLGVRLKVEKR